MVCVCVCVPTHLCSYLNLSVTQDSVFKEFFFNVFPAKEIFLRPSLQHLPQIKGGHAACRVTQTCI